MRRIEKKVWPKYFQLMEDGEKNVDLRLADFDVSVGDEIRFNEYDPVSKQYSGRALIKKVSHVNKVRLDIFHSREEIDQWGHWIIEFEETKDELSE